MIVRFMVTGSQYPKWDTITPGEEQRCDKKFGIGSNGLQYQVEIGSFIMNNFFIVS